MLPRHRLMRYFRKPTRRQVKLLRKAGIIPPRTRDDCEDTIFFLWRTASQAYVRTNGAGERIARMRSAQRTWIGRGIRHRCDGRIGRVLAVSTYGAFTLAESPNGEFVEEHPFLAYVRWRNNGPAGVINLTLIEPVESTSAPSEQTVP